MNQLYWLHLPVAVHARPTLIWSAHMPIQNWASGFRRTVWIGSSGSAAAKVEACAGATDGKRNREGRKMSASVAIIKRPRSMRRREIMVDEKEKKAKCTALARSRTRIDCLEGNHANRYTTDARQHALRLRATRLYFACTDASFGRDN